ncbi:uncharacterized protein ABDE67_013313 [Symphorus nematophorus]
MRGIMRSFTSYPPTDMVHLFWFSLLLTHLPLSESKDTAESCLSQPNTVIWRKMGQSAVLPCTVSSHCTDKDWEYEWFSFKDNFHLRLKPHDNHLKYRLLGASLHIKSLNANDSGIYHCAAVSTGKPASGEQHVGMGTTLVVREKVKIMVKHILLWLFFVLFSIYGLALVTLIIKKNGCKKKHKTHRDNSTKKRQFRDVLQEMYSRSSSEKSKQTANTGRSQVEAACSDHNSSADDIYQNV